MKRVLVFLGLKVVEVSAVFGIPYGLGKLMNIIFPKYVIWMETGTVRFWSMFGVGIFTLIFGVVIAAVIAGIYYIISINWEKAGEIAGK